MMPNLKVMNRMSSTLMPRYKILIVDDSRTSTEVLRSFILPLGYEVAVAHSGEQALQLIPEIKPDLILLDVMMAGMDGFETCVAIKQTPFDDIPVIFVTTLTEMDAVVRGFEVGGIDYITKPAKPKEVQAKIKTHLQLRQANLDLQCMNLNKDRFFSIVAQDLSEPLNTIFSTTDLLAESLHQLERNDIQPLLQGIHTAAGHLLKKLENLLEWSLLQTGQLPYEPTAISIQQLLTHCVERHQALAQSKHIELIIDHQTPLLAYADLHMLETTLFNLLSNAIRFTPDYGQVNLSSAAVDNHINITIQDTGIGINPGLLPKLFRLDSVCVSADTQHAKGAGLGLLLCKTFMERNHGQIWVNNNAPNNGTRITISLPSLPQIADNSPS